MANRTLNRPGAAAAIATLVLISSPALATTDVEQAEALIREGVRLRAQDQTAKALASFQHAYELAPTPRAAAQLGLCELELADYVAAERHLTEALAHPDNPWIAQHKSVLKRELDAATSNVGELVLTVSPSSAEVSLNGRPTDRALLTAPIRLGKGPVDVDVRAPGYSAAHETITIAGGKREQRAFALVPEPTRPVVAAADVGSTAVSPRVAGAPPAPILDAAPTPEPAPAGMRPARTAAWIAAGAAVAGLAFGTAEAFNAASKRDAFNGHTGTVGGVAYPDCGTANLSAACKPLKDAYDQAFTLSMVGFAAAGALAITSAVLFVYSGPGHGDNPEGSATGHAFACVPNLTSRGFGCALRF